MGAVDYLHDIPEKGDPDEDDPFFWISEMKHAGSDRHGDSTLRNKGRRMAVRGWQK